MSDKDTPEILEEPEDHKRLLYAILRQAIDDYVKLQHPKFRSKKYLQEAFSSSVDLLFDSSYRMLHVKDEYGQDLSLKDLITSLMKDDRNDLTKLRNHAIEQACEFWENKFIRTLEIPRNFVCNGHVYTVHHNDEEGYLIDFCKKEIYLDKQCGSSSEEMFLTAIFQIVLKHENILLGSKEIENKIASGIFKILKVNSCFTGA